METTRSKFVNSVVHFVNSEFPKALTTESSKASEKFKTEVTLDHLAYNNHLLETLTVGFYIFQVK